MNVVSVKSLKQCTWDNSDDPNAFVLMLTDQDGKDFMLTASVATAGQMTAALIEAMKAIRNAGRRVEVSAMPERVMRYDAQRSTIAGEEVVTMMLVGERSTPFLGVLTPSGAKQLAALLTVHAERLGKGRAN